MANHGWRMIPGAPVVPQHCAVFPHIGNASGRMFVDTGMNLNSYDPHIYISDVAVDELAKFMGYVPGSDADEKVKAAEARANEAEADLLIAEMRIQFLEAHKAAVELIQHDPDAKYVPPNGRKTYGR